MQLIAADIGNSSIKIAVDHAAKDDRWCFETIIRDCEPIDFDNLDVGSEPAFWSVCSVNRNRHQQLKDSIEKHRPHDHFHLIKSDDVDLKTNVESRAQLGRDRLVAAWMAVQLNDQVGPLVVIDAGTAVTIDLVDQNLVFQGGVIFPGAESNLRLLAETTDGLPDLQNENRRGSAQNTFKDPLGKSTSEAILKGVHYSQVTAIRRIANELAHHTGQRATVFMTGGGMIDFERHMVDEWQHVPDLVLRGARAIGQELIPRTGINLPSSAE